MGLNGGLTKRLSPVNTGLYTGLNLLNKDEKELGYECK